MDAVTLLIAGVIALLVAYAAYRRYRLDSDRSRRLLESSGQLWDGLEPLSFAGQGALQTVRAVQLSAGRYRLDYWFPDTVSVRVELLSAGADDRETILIRSGEGAVSFTINAAGPYVLEVTPADKNAEWELEISRSDLPSQDHPV